MSFMRIAVTGSTGLIGSALVTILTNGGHEVVRMRRPAEWNPDAGTVNASVLNGVDAVVHLAGENIATSRWTATRKTRIRDSRVKGTTLIAETFGKMGKRPQVLVRSSAIGYYGDRGAEVLREDRSRGHGVLVAVCSQWSAATATARRSVIRRAH